MKKINKGYELVEGKWVNNGYLEVAKTKEQMDQDKITELRLLQSDITQYLAETDVKVTKHRDQLELLNMNLIQETDLTQEQYEDMLIARQNKRMEYRNIEQSIYDIMNPTVSTEEAKPYEG